jgi:hypothetical protein
VLFFRYHRRFINAFYQETTHRGEKESLEAAKPLARLHGLDRFSPRAQCGDGFLSFSPVMAKLLERIQ